MTSKLTAERIEEIRKEFDFNAPAYREIGLLCDMALRSLEIPEEPTEEMIEAVLEVITLEREEIVMIYRAMLRAGKT